MLWDQEYNYHNLEDLTQPVEEYMEYYNNERVKGRLKSLTLIKYQN